MPQVSVRRIFRDSLRAWRRDFWYLTLLAAILEAPIALAEVLLHVAPGIEIETEGGLRLLSSGGLPITIYGILAHHFLSGIMEAVEGAERHGHDRPTFVELARTLPWGRLLIADIVVNAAIAFGLVLLLIPGLLIGAYWAAALPLINMERQPVVATLRRSVALTRGYFWKSLTVWLLTAAVIAGVQEAVVETFSHVLPGTWWEFLVHLGSDVLFLPIQALPIVILAFELVTANRDRLPPPVPAPAGEPAH